MLAAQFDRFGPPDVLSVRSAPDPHPGPAEIRIRVMAAGISPVDLSLRSGNSPSSKSLPLPHIPGVDAAGVVDEIGAGVTGVAIGDEVFGSVDISRLGGASAELAVLKNWAAKPSSLPWDQAGAAGTSIETATRALDILDPREGSTLLIDGASGGVGSVAVLLALARGAQVIGTGRQESQAFISELGATPVIYGTGLPERVHALGLAAVDLALDVAGAGSLPDLVAITGDARRVLTIADFSASQHGVRLSMGELAGEASGQHGLERAAELWTEGRFHVPLKATFPLARIAEGHAAAGEGPRQGKVALTVE